jgi:hypothetical protein
MAVTNFEKPLNRKKHDKFHIALLAPILAIAFMVGWSLYLVGQTNQTKPKRPQRLINKTSTNPNDLKLIMIPQQKQILAN